MLGSFTKFLTENGRATGNGKLYPKFGHAIIMLGEVQTEFGKNKGINTSIDIIEKSVSLKKTLAEKVKADANVVDFDLELNENVSTANILMENEYASMPIHEVTACKELMLVSESRLPTLVISMDESELSNAVDQLQKLGYSKRNVHVAFNVNEMTVNMAVGSAKPVIESLDFDGLNASSMLSLAGDIDLGDVYVAFNECVSTASILPLTEIRIKSNSRSIKLSELNRTIMEHLVTTEGAETKHGLDESIKPGIAGYKAYDFRLGNFDVFESSVFGVNSLPVEPINHESWNDRMHENTTFFANGWILEHDKKSVRLTNAENALRAGATCESYVVEFKNDTYPLVDVVSMLRESVVDWSCASVAESMLELNGKTSIDKQVVTAYSVERPSNGVYHPRSADRLREAIEMKTTEDLVRVIANDQFTEFSIAESTLDVKLDSADIHSVISGLVNSETELTIEADTVTFDKQGITYKVLVDIK